MSKIPSVSALYSKLSKNNLQSNAITTDELWYSRLIGRRISIYFTWLFLNIGLTPNQATLISFILGIFGLFFMSMGNSLYFFLGFVFFHLYIIVDSSDGEMARFLNKKSDMGAFYDKMLHYVMKIGIIIVISAQLYYRDQSPYYIVFGLIAALVSGFSSTYYHLLPTNINVSYADQVKSSGKLVGFIRKIFRAITGDIELSILLLFLVMVESLTNSSILWLLKILLASQLLLLSLYVVQQTILDTIKR